MPRGAILVALASLLVAACVVGDPTMPPPGQGGGGDDVDAGASGRDGGGGGGGGGDGGANNTCEDVVSPAPDGHHNPGTTCIASGCHDGNTAGAPRFTVAGTLYTSKAGTTPRAGAHIIIPTGGGNPVKLTVASNGNFWSATPATVNSKPKASGCPNLVQMPTSTTSGNCNTAGCHSAGARIALPL